MVILGFEPRPQDGRCRRNHGAMAFPFSVLVLSLSRRLLLFSIPLMQISVTFTFTNPGNSDEILLTFPYSQDLNPGSHDSRRADLPQHRLWLTFFLITWWDNQRKMFIACGIRTRVLLIYHKEETITKSFKQWRYRQVKTASMWTPDKVNLVLNWLLLTLLNTLGNTHM